MIVRAPHSTVPFGFTRRRLLAGTAMVGLLLAARGSAWAAAVSPPLERATDRAEFFTDAERRVVAAMVDRMIPADDLGPGGIEAHVPEFIERQLAGDFGRATTWYMKPPHAKGSPEQGYQLAMTPAELYRQSLAKLEHLLMQSDNASFAELPEDRQETVMTALGKGEMDTPDFDGKTFFAMLHGNTMEGFFADPIYGGNRDMIGWKLIGYPGVRYDWRPYIEKFDTRVDLPVISLMGNLEGTGADNR